MKAGKSFHLSRRRVFRRCSITIARRVTCCKKNSSMHNQHPKNPRIFTRLAAFSGATLTEFCGAAQRGTARRGVWRGRSRSQSGDWTTWCLNLPIKLKSRLVGQSSNHSGPPLHTHTLISRLYLYLPLNCSICPESTKIRPRMAHAMYLGFFAGAKLNVRRYMIKSPGLPARLQ